jgi:ABC-type transport system substrate-binding protein
LCSLSVNHWRYILRKLSGREINLILIGIGTAAAAMFFLGGYDYLFLRISVPDEGGTYTEGIVGEPRYINPAVSVANEVDRDITTLIFSGLVKHNEMGEIVPDLAESYEIKDDGKTYEFTLRENLLWPDKTPITSDDVIFTINLIKDATCGRALKLKKLMVEPLL